MSDDSNLASSHEAARDQDSRLHYRRLRAPKQSGESLQLPPLTQTVSNWTDRCKPAADAVSVGGTPLSELQNLGRSELRNLAQQYTRRYRDIDLDDRDVNSMVMSGHQPLLFHPGVWFKNFALSSVGQAVGATPINLIVDNDVSGASSIKCPAYANGKATVCMVPVDGPHSAVPHESMPIIDEALFSSFDQRVTKHVKDCLNGLGGQMTPLVSKLWRHVMASRRSLGDSASLGAVLAAGRHQLEQEAGLKTLEVPVSLVSQTDAFARFATSIVNRQAEFNVSYNGRVKQYRSLHGIRSKAHPVPELENSDGWLESPFWIWSVAHPTRKRLFVKPVGREVQLSDRAGWTAQFSSQHLAAAWREIEATQVSIRPRALITTMFSRLVLSDLFLHGIGGAKYDQLTDVIAHDFFGVALPPFSTLTATKHLPLGYPVVVAQDRTELRHQIRQRKYHPERFIDPVKPAQAIIARKRAAIENSQLSRIDRHREIEETNRLLGPFVSDQTEDLVAKTEIVSSQLRNSQILNSREYSFCLFPESLIDELKHMSQLV